MGGWRESGRKVESACRAAKGQADSGSRDAGDDLPAAAGNSSRNLRDCGSRDRRRLAGCTLSHRCRHRGRQRRVAGQPDGQTASRLCLPIGRGAREIARVRRGAARGWGCRGGGRAARWGGGDGGITIRAGGGEGGTKGAGGDDLARRGKGCAGYGWIVWQWGGKVQRDVASEGGGWRGKRDGGRLGGRVGAPEGAARRGKMNIRRNHFGTGDTVPRENCFFFFPPPIEIQSMILVDGAILDGFFSLFLRFFYLVFISRRNQIARE